MISPEYLTHTPEIIATIGTLAISLAFSRQSRKKIYERDRVCRVCGSVSHLEAAHIDHNKSNPNYDDPSNGRLLCLPDHLEDHITREGRNGLTVPQNRWAIHAMILKLKGKSNQVDSD